MERQILPDDISADQRIFYNALLDGAASVPILLDNILSTAPTTANGLLKEGQRGLYGGFLYETVNGVTFKYGVAT